MKNTYSEITSESILCQKWLLLLVIKQEYTQDHFHTIATVYMNAIWLQTINFVETKILSLAHDQSHHPHRHHHTGPEEAILHWSGKFWEQDHP